MISRVESASHRALRRNLTAMNADGFAFSIMVGIGETYLPAFMLARGSGELNAALIATVPVLLGSIVQLLAPRLLRLVGSHRRFVVATASVQAFSMVLLSLLAVLPEVAAWVVFIPATLYWAGGLSTGPAWNTWVEQLVPARIRSGFFARRSRLCHVGVLLGLIAGGLLLRWSALSGQTLSVFAILFGTGALGRAVSAAMLARQTESLGSRLDRLPTRAECDGAVTVRHRSVSRTMTASSAGSSVFRQSVWQRLTDRQRWQRPGPAARLVLFLMAVQTAVHVSGPYFNPFMLKVLGLSWVDYMFLLSLGFIGKMLSLPWAGRMANRLGPDRLLWIGAVGIMPVSALWFVRQDVWFLACVQIVSGLVWGCYELAMLLMFLGRIPAARRVQVLTWYNFGNSVAMVLGTLIGALILSNAGRSASGYLTVFVASAGLRLLSLLALPGRRRALRASSDAARRLIRRPALVQASDAAPTVDPIRISRPLAESSLARTRASGTSGDAASELASSVVVLSMEAGDLSSVTRKLLETGGGSSRRRDATSPVTRRPARADDQPFEIGPLE